MKNIQKNNKLTMKNIQKNNKFLEWGELPVLCKVKIQELIESGYKEVPSNNIYLIEDISNASECKYLLRYKSYIFEPLLIKEGTVEKFLFSTTYTSEMITYDVYVCHLLKVFLMMSNLNKLKADKIDKEIKQAKEELLKIYDK